VANLVPLPQVGDELMGKIKGTRLVFYAPESVKIHVVEIPYDQGMVDMIFGRCEDWWNQHVVPSIPPLSGLPEERTVLQKISGEYTTLTEADAWEDAVQRLLLAKKNREELEKQEEEEKEYIKQAMKQAGLSKVILPSGVKLNYIEQDGKESLDLKALQAAHPEIDIKQFYRQGKSFWAFRMFEKSAKKG
jgi:predicted phage-related endonuclease